MRWGFNDLELSMVIKENISLKAYNTFGIDANARFFTAIESIVDLQKLLVDPQYKTMPKLILGGGSNLLFTRDFEGLVIKNDITGMEVVKEDKDHVWLKAGAGENWHQFVLYCIEQGYAGIENLSLIPGTVGAAPMQNIGAYGVEIKDCFEALKAVEIATGEVHTFNNVDCRFGYRYSIFKDEVKDQYVIANVTFRLNKNPSYNISYGAIQETLDKMDVATLSIKAISDAVIHIRQSKLPDPAKIGNAGSFFKNPTIDKILFEALKVKFPPIPGYNLPGNQVKVPAGWLIEQCGWKGKTIGNVGVHQNQALVLINRGNAIGEEVKQLALKIQESVTRKFGISLVPEVNMV